MSYDSHCHLDLMDNMMSMIQSVSKKNTGILAVGTTPQAYLQEIKFCAKAEKIHVALGMHPQLVGSGYDDLPLFESLVQDCHYIGEVGLDFSKSYSGTKDQQIEVFEKIVCWCEQYGNKVVSIHSVKSAATVIELLRKSKKNSENTYILHWFTGSATQLKIALELGCYFSINPKMFRTKSGIELIQNIPLNRILLETDAPFSIKVEDADELNHILQNVINNISILKGSNIKQQLVMNEKKVFRYL